MIISIIGFMGAGKSELARWISERFSAKALDLDSVIEKNEACSIPDIFTTKGESHFRDLEAIYLSKIIEQNKSLNPDGEIEIREMDEVSEIDEINEMEEIDEVRGISEKSRIKLCLNSREELIDYLETNYNLTDLTIISLGGGTLNNLNLIKLIKENTLCIYLNTSLKTILERLKVDNGNRPMLKRESNTSLDERVEELYSERVHSYLEAADIILTNP